MIFAFKIWLKDPRTILPFGKDLAAREETTAVRGKHFGNCFPLRLSLQKLFKPFLCFFVFVFFFVLFVVKFWLKVPRATTLCLKSDARRTASQKQRETRSLLKAMRDAPPPKHSVRAVWLPFTPNGPEEAEDKMGPEAAFSDRPV